MNATSNICGKGAEQLILTATTVRSWGTQYNILCSIFRTGWMVGPSCSYASVASGYLVYHSESGAGAPPK